MKFFYELANCLRAGIYVAGANGRCIYANPWLCELFGLSRQRMLGVGWMQSIHPEDRERVKNFSRARLRAIDSAEIRYRVVRGKSVIWVCSSPSALRDSYGRFMGRIGSVVNVTESMVAKEQVRAAWRAMERLPLAELASGGEQGSLELNLGAPSPQQWRILALVGQGLTNKEIAAQLGLSPKTVKNYLSALFRKVNVRRRSEAVALFARMQNAGKVSPQQSSAGVGGQFLKER